MTCHNVIVLIAAQVCFFAAIAAALLYVFLNRCSFALCVLQLLQLCFVFAAIAAALLYS
jgi:hypothetical protein